jgi:branched-chain amino acid transport system substrate-binding protein
MKLIKYAGSALVILAFLLTLLPVYATTAKAETGEPIKIGLVIAFSFAPAKHGFCCRDGYQMAMEEINAAGGVLGRPLELVSRDSKVNTQVARAMAKELVLKEKVFMIVGAVPGRICLALSDYAKSAKVPYFNCLCATERLCGEYGHRYVFSGSSMSRHFNKGNVKYMLKQFPQAKRYYLFGVDNETGHSMIDSYTRYLNEFKPPDVKIVGTSFCKTKETDYTPYITAILTAKPDVLYAGFGGSQNVAFMKACKQAGLDKKMLITSYNINDVMMARAIGDGMPDGAIGYNPYLPYYYEHPANKRFVKKYKEKYGELPTNTSSLGYFNCYFIAEALKKAGTVNREKFIDALEGLTIKDTPLGELTMRVYDHQVMVPLIVGQMRKDPAYPFYITKDNVVLMKAEDVMPSIEEVKAARKATKK